MQHESWVLLADNADMIKSVVANVQTMPVGCELNIKQIVLSTRSSKTSVVYTQTTHKSVSTAMKTNPATKCFVFGEYWKAVHDSMISLLH